jgi:hypothetical protein
VRRSIQLDERLVKLPLMRKGMSGQSLLKLFVDMINCLAAAQTPIAVRLAIAQFVRFGASS